MKSILVPMEKTDLTNATLQTALILARRFGSYIEGFALRAAISDFVAADLIVADAWAVAERRDAELAREAHAAFEGFMQANAVPPLRPGAGGPAYGWAEPETTRDGFVGGHARVFDVAVFGRPGTSPTGSSISAVETVLFESGRPIVIAPPAPPPQIGDNIVIAWNRSTETARAVAVALPLLLQARKVTVLTTLGAATPGPDGAQLARSLERHGIAVEAASISTESRSAGGAILKEAAALGCDLLVKGAYTQSRLRQMIFGGATSHILARTNLPVFMAN